ncbi:MAG: DmsE family decaheme c-type cytochrome [Burkholderiales bacterium]|nr:DmsE family decaheme c-type cytochrome [Burkholderiales bacterium]MDE2394857.1 DmsE family decaheme c-type cytochrome [Burkholderiales bacterium]MDE2456204.1 DmsE family decaheme c-type cytochrome [Burkholderiales bacterium]
MLALSFLTGGAAWAADEPAASGPAANALKQDAVCTRCHDETETRPVLSIFQTKHGVVADARTPTCQSCHGESAKHVAGGPGVGDASRPAPDVLYKPRGSVYKASEAATQVGACIACHKGGLRTHWSGSQHQMQDIPCAACHKVHVKSDPVLTKATQPEVCFACHKEQRAQTHLVSTHPLDAGKMACSDCHNPHGSAGPKLLKKNSVVETCTTCHAEKRGPFLWEHQPVNEDCTNCHTPHGSNISPLLKDRPPFLCDDCHDGPHNSQAPYGSGAAGLQGGLLGTLASGATKTNPNTSASGRACLNCHVMVHGSNSPAGAFLHR